MSSDVLWDLEPHTKIKHDILREYLKAWFPILSSHFQYLVYIDGFSGPGRYSHGEIGSPVVALETAAKSLPSHVAAKFYFVEKAQPRFEHLKAELASRSFPARFAIKLILNEFKDVFPEIVEELKTLQPPPPVFAFIDPFGFSGVLYDDICKLLRMPSSEVFINFMADSVNRWLGTNQERQHMIELFGTQDCVQLVHREDRIRQLRQLYQSQLQKAATFVQYFEMKNHQDRVIYYLFFASNSLKGFEKMKEAMWKVAPEGNFSFSDASDPSQMILFTANHNRDLFQLLSKEWQGQERVSYQDLWAFTNRGSVYLETHLKASLKIAEEEGKVTVHEYKEDGSRRRAGKFPPGTLIDFKSRALPPQPPQQGTLF